MYVPGPVRQIVNPTSQVWGVGGSMWTLCAGSEDVFAQQHFCFTRTTEHGVSTFAQTTERRTDMYAEARIEEASCKIKAPSDYAKHMRNGQRTP